MEENAWWKAKISQKRSAVGKILISNRVDCCSDRLTGAKVRVRQLTIIIKSLIK